MTGTADSAGGVDTPIRLVEGVARVDDLDAFLAQVDAIRDAHAVTVQAFDARYVVDRAHIERALALADRAAERGENVARDRAVEVLLYAAGRRQIDQALELGVEEGEHPVVVLVAAEPEAEGDADGEDAGAEDGDADAPDVADDPVSAAATAVASFLDPAETLGRYDEARVRRFYGVTDAELTATEGDLADIVHERVALLDVEK